METQQHRSLAPDPLTEPEKCSGIRAGFTIISVLGMAIFVCAALALASPSIYSGLKVATETIFAPDAADTLQRGGGQPILMH